VRPAHEEDPLESYSRFFNIVEVSTGLFKGALLPWRLMGSKNSEGSIRALEANAIRVEAKWRVS
jgi:hypothetical protein